jgi:hypothetical protein
MSAVRELAPLVGIVMACVMLAVARATYYRRLVPRTASSRRPAPPRALDAQERHAVLDVLHEPRFVDLAPAEGVAVRSRRAEATEELLGAVKDEHEATPRTPSLRGGELLSAHRRFGEPQVVELELLCEHRGPRQVAQSDPLDGPEHMRHGDPPR